MQTMKDKNTALICNNDGLIASHGGTDLFHRCFACYAADPSLCYCFTAEVNMQNSNGAGK